jgi:hypothetical protein
MNRDMLTMRKLAARLVENETWGKSDAVNSTALFLVTEKLHAPLATLMGKAGYRAVIGRALSLAKRQVHCLGGVQVNPDGSLTGTELLPENCPPAEFIEGRLVVIARLLDLLVAFIGAALTVGLINQIWPKVKTDDLDFTKEN